MGIKVGDRVKIAKSSQFYGQHHGIGRVVRESGKTGEGTWWEVSFNDPHYVNGYRDYDLEDKESKILELLKKIDELDGIL